LEEAEAKYIATLRKARQDLAEQVHYVQKKSRALPGENGGPSQQKPIRRYRLMHAWFLYFLQSSMLGPRRSRR
jgi:hypothetical protein